MNKYKAVFMFELEVEAEDETEATCSAAFEVDGMEPTNITITKI